MLPRIRALVPLAALAALLSVPAVAQDSTHAKRVREVSTGMTTAQATAILGAPARTRVQGRHTFLYYSPNCEGCEEDYLVIRDCRVVDARLEGPERYYVPAGLPEGIQAPAPAECAIATGDGTASGAPLAAAPEPRQPPERPNDTNPRGAPVANQPPLAPPAASVAAPAPASSAAPAPAPPPAPAAAPPAPAPPSAASGTPAAQMQGPPPATNPQDWREYLRLGPPDEGIIALPAASIINPTALGIERGQAYVGVGYQLRTRFTEEDDAAFAIGVGVGDRVRYFAVEGTVLSYSTLRDNGPFETGGVGFKVHRALGESGGIAAGIENVHTWGGSDAGRSRFGVGTYAFRRTDEPSEKFNSLTVSLGVGDGRFRTEDDVVADEDAWNVFGSLSLQVVPAVALVGDWTGQDLYAGISVTPFRQRPLVVNLSLADVTGSAGDGARPIMSIVYGVVIPHSFP